MKPKPHSCDCEWCGVDHELWVAAFRAYQKALAEPYFDQDDESRQSNRQEVERCFDRLKQLAGEG